MALLLSPALLRAMAQLRLRVSSPIHMLHKGESRSRRQGSSVEFSDYREYEPGDDYRHIDWNIYSRLDRLFVKLFAEEQNRSLNLLLDTSESMDQGEPSKSLYSRQIAAALSYIAVWAGDEVRLGNVAEHLRWVTPRWKGRHRAKDLFNALESLHTGGLTDLSRALQGLASSRRTPASATILVSDMFDPAWETALRRLAALPGTSVLIHLLSPDDWNPQATGEFDLTDAETGERLTVTLDSAAIRDFQKVARDWAESIRRRCLQLGISCFHLDTSYPIEDFVLGALRRGGLVQ